MVRRDTIESLTNRSARFVWGVLIVYTPHDGLPVSTTPAGLPLKGVFDSAHVLITTIDGQEIVERAPMLDMVLSDLAAEPVEGDKFTISEGPHSGETYTVTHIEFDSAQAAKLVCVQGDHSA